MLDKNGVKKPVPLRLRLRPFPLYEIHPNTFICQFCNYVSFIKELQNLHELNSFIFGIAQDLAAPIDETVGFHGSW